MTIRGITPYGHKANHLVASRGALIIVSNCSDWSSAYNELWNRGNADPNMNYIINWSWSGSTGNWTFQGEPVRLVPEP